MRFIQEFGFTVKVGEEEAYQQWLIENEAALAASYPEGTRHKAVVDATVIDAPSD